MRTFLVRTGAVSDSAVFWAGSVTPQVLVISEDPRNDGHAVIIVFFICGDSSGIDGSVRVADYGFWVGEQCACMCS